MLLNLPDPSAGRETRRARRFGVAAAAVVVGAVFLLAAAAWAPLPAEVKLENSRVKVTQVTYPPGVPRPRHTRPASQVIVFLDDCVYERIDSTTGEKTIRHRKAGDVIWHERGEDAPQLTNLGRRPYRTLVIELR
jgi:quercetin dioxygenase-like cupin family protein